MQIFQRLGANRRRSGFTLAEAAVTIAIVALTLTAVMESLERAKLKAAHTQLEKTAKELGIMTLGAIESGQWWDDIESGRSGSYADNEYPDFYWELALGEETFVEFEENEEGSGFDNWAHNRELALERDYSSGDDEEDEEAVEPYEQVRIRVTFPKLREYENEVILERWVVWEQVYGVDEEEEREEGAGNGQGGPGGSGPDSGRPPISDGPSGGKN